MTGKDTVVDASERCSSCKSAKRKEKVWWICRKNCVERNNIDTCMMKPAQFEPIEQPHPEQEFIITQKWISELYANLILNGLQYTANRMYDQFRSRPHSPLITKELVEELAKREGVKEIVVQPYEWYQISGEKEQWKTGTGPARILVVWD